MKMTLKQAKEIAKRNGWKVKKDLNWNDIIVTWEDNTTSSFYDDMEDCIQTMLYRERTKPCKTS